MNHKTFPKIELVENLFLLGWGCALSAFIISFLLKKLKEHTIQKTKPTFIKPTLTTESEKKTNPARHKKYRIGALKKAESESELAPFTVNIFFHGKKHKNDASNISAKKTVTRLNSTETAVISPIQSSSTSTLQTEVRFSDEFVYPSTPESAYQLYPLPGYQRSKPVAKITAGGHSALIYNTQFGVLVTDDFPDESHVAAHQHCLQNGHVVFAKDTGFFKTHPAGSAGNERVYATSKIVNKDGLTLHLFDKALQHAHGRK